MISLGLTGFPHSEILRSQLGYQLAEAYRRFQRLSSPLDTKTSTVCPSWLGRTTPTSTPAKESEDRPGMGAKPNALVEICSRLLIAILPGGWMATSLLLGQHPG